MMTIRYMNGSMYDAVLLMRTETMLRVALHGGDDVLELKQIAGVWVTDDCEPVQVDFAWSRLRASEPAIEEDCICPHDLAAHLIHLLYTGDEEPAANASPLTRIELPLTYRGVVS